MNSSMTLTIPMPSFVMAKEDSSFVAYDNLDNFNENTNYLLLLRDVSNEVINTVKEKEQLSIIQLLRRMRKYQHGLFDLAFDNIISVFTDRYLIQPGYKSCVLTHSLLFVKEIFSHYILDFNDSWLGLLYPPIEDIVFCPNEQMSQLAREVIHSFAVNMKYTTTLRVLFNSAENLNGSKAREQFLYETFERFFKSTNEINLQLGFDWNYIIEILHLGSYLDFTVIQKIFLTLRSALDKSWGEFLKSLLEPNRNLVNKIISNISFNN